MMVRLILCSVLVLCLSAPAALAQEQVRVRTGDHKEYSRLVFDWDKQVKYKLDQSTPGKLVVAFEHKAGIKSGPAPEQKLRNFSGFAVLGEDPLRVSLKIPATSRVRGFFAGSRLVIDVYNPSGVPKAPAKVAKTEKPKPAKPKPVAKAPEKDDAVEVEEPKTVARDKIEEPDQADLKEPESQPEKPQPRIAKETLVRPNLIALSATKSFAMATFEMNGEIWMVTDQADLNFTPQVSGPQASELSPVKSFQVDGVTAFKTKSLEDSYVRSQGGGLLWRVVISESDEQQEAPTKPVREDIEENQPRSGKIIWPFEGAKKVTTVTDSRTGTRLKVVSVDSAKQFSGPALGFVDFDTLPSVAGLAIRPKVDDLEVEITSRGVEISRPGGLALSPEEEIKAALIDKKNREDSQRDPQEEEKPWTPVFDFKNWEMGGLSALEENKTIILGGLNDLPEERRIEGILTLAKMYLANGLAAESLGFLGLASNMLPGIEDNKEYRAIEAAARAVDSKNEIAFMSLSQDDLKQYDDIAYWRAYALANLGDWQQAEEVLPENLEPLHDYPPYIYNRVALVLSEVALRAGNVEGAEDLLVELDKNQDTLWYPQKAALSYLKGEAARQRGNTKETKKLWKPLVFGKDDLYRAKAGLALTRLEMEEGKLSPETAIDNLERLRYAWRGDYLEAQINYWLGKTYFENGQFAKGLNIMRDAATYAVGTGLAQRITAEMTDIFGELFLSERLKDVSPLDATALYEQFTELVPPGDKGNKVVEMLAERLVQADLLERAAELLEPQIEHRLSGTESYRVTVRLAVIRLLDNKPADALKTLDKATQLLQALPEESRTPARYLELSLLRARSLSRQGRPDQALALLNDLERGPDVNRLKADIAWNAGYWDDAAEALDDVMVDENISLTRPLEDAHKMLVLHRAVALNLASDRIALANMREKYTDAMAQTDKAKIFEVITRPRQSAALADRETLMNIVAETDLFADFLNSYRTVVAPSN